MMQEFLTQSKHPDRTIEPTDHYYAYVWYAWFAVFFIASQYLGYTFGYGVQSISVLWPPTGVLGAALALLSRRHWIPIILIASVLDFLNGATSQNFRTDPDFHLYLIIGLITNPITAIVFASTFRIFVPNARPLSEPKVFGFYVIICVTLNTAFVSFLSMSLLSLLIEGFPVVAGWQQWWYSEFMGLLMFATPIIMIASSAFKTNHAKFRVYETAAMLTVFAAVTALLFSAQFEGTSFRYYKVVFMLPIFAWIISRFGAVVMSLATLVFTLVILIMLIYHESSFEIPGRSEAGNVLAVQGFLLPVTLTVLLIASILEHRKHQFEVLLENQLQMKSLRRMESLGTMAAGVAHDFGNQAIAARSYLSVIKTQLDKPNKTLSNAVRGLDESLDGAQSLTKSLMIFARDGLADQSSEPVAIDICQAAQETADSMNQLLASRHALVCNVPAESIYVLAHTGDIQRILSNLIINARDASEPGQQVELAVRKHNSGVWLLVTDHGKGIPDQDRPRIFDPFFTTKPRGQGTGLGLAVVSGIVHELGGKIDVASTVGEGTTMVISLPILDPQDAD